ncbi:hypothetical protein [Faecalibaculum rodentium]|uniref:hypothetical protein n=1 Tax=Faecalibaculum rodentium TaxID=1702221 RepID=UPI00259B9296|nr:hypothetical protein [Faecalibaculum rodentium]
MKDNRKIWIWVAVIVIVILAVWGISAANKNETAAEDKIQVFGVCLICHYLARVVIFLIEC